MPSLLEYGSAPLFLIPAGLAALYLFYLQLLPKPIPGVPYNKEAASSILGDIPSFTANTSTTTDWLLDQARRHASPICQLFLSPPFAFRRGPSLVLVSDHREAQDVLLRRKGFDRSDLTITFLGSLMPEQHISLKTGPLWKSHRRLIRDLMLPSYLHGFAAPHIYQTVLRLVGLWQEKASRAEGRSFNADGDISSTGLDAILDFAFGDSLPQRALPDRIEAALDRSNATVLAEDDVMDFAAPPMHPSLLAILRISEAIGELFASAFPSLLWSFMRLLPAERKSMHLRDELVKGQIRQALDRLPQSARDSTGKSAIEMMLLREREAAEKEGRRPEYFSRGMIDEVLGFVVGGHDTTSTAVSWLIKLLTDTQAPQTTLRAALCSAFTAAKAEQRNPTIQEIINTPIPYLDATIEEGLRVGGAVLTTHRQCDHDTVVLGHHFPKGTIFMFFARGPGITETSYNADEKVRSPSSIQAAASSRPEWDEDDRGSFIPERWLNEKGEYDSTAGPILPFGLGLRACYGRRLAYLEMRILVTLLIWNFEFLPTPLHLSGYDANAQLTHKPKQFYVKLKKPGLSKDIRA